MANKTEVYIHDDIEILNHSIPPMERDDLLTNDNDGVRFLFDLANGYSYAAGEPTNGKVVKDMAEISVNGTIANPAGLLASGGGGIDFTNILAIDNGIRVPATVAADLWADQEYIVCGYFKLPVAANWPPQTGSGLGGTFMTACSGTEDYTDSPEIGIVACNLGAVGRISFRRQGVIPTNATDIALSGMHTIHGGLLVQIAYWRTATECNFRLKSSGGTSLGTAAAAGAKNTSDFSAKQMNWGPFGQYGLPNSGDFRTGLRLYRGFVINHKRMGYSSGITRPGYDPVSILNRDYDSVIARGVFS